MVRRSKPNILVAGTPGTGKTTVCNRVIELEPLQVINISDFAREHGFLKEYDERFLCPVIDERRLFDYIEPNLLRGGCIVDYHDSGLLTARTIDAVFVLRCSTEILYDRLVARGYGPTKIQGNIECEIFEPLVQEALMSFAHDRVFDLSVE